MQVVYIHANVKMRTLCEFFGRMIECEISRMQTHSFHVYQMNHSVSTTLEDSSSSDSSNKWIEWLGTFLFLAIISVATYFIYPHLKSKQPSSAITNISASYDPFSNEGKVQFIRNHGGYCCELADLIATHIGVSQEGFDTNLNNAMRKFPNCFQ